MDSIAKIVEAARLAGFNVYNHLDRVAIEVPAGKNQANVVAIIVEKIFDISADWEYTTTEMLETMFLFGESKTIDLGDICLHRSVWLPEYDVKSIRS